MSSRSFPDNMLPGAFTAARVSTGAEAISGTDDAHTTFTDTRLIDRSITEAFNHILAVGGQQEAGSYFSARAKTSAPGQVIRTVVPVVHGHDIRLEQAVARLVAYQPYRRMVIVQESPWESRTEIILKPSGSKTLVSTRTTVSAQTVELVANMLDNQHESLPAPQHDARQLRVEPTHRIALVTSMSGHSSLYGRSTVNCAKLAEQHINRAGGILGKPIQVSLVNDASSPAHALQQLLTLDSTHSVSAGIGVHSSAIAAAIDSSGWARNKPYLYAPLSESTLPQRTLIAIGDTEHDQLSLAIPHLARALRSDARWVLVGNDFSWPRQVNRAARAHIESSGGTVIGEYYVDLARPKITEIIDAVCAAAPDAIVSSLVGWGLVEFEERMHRVGLRQSIRSLDLLLDECSRELLGEAAHGIWSAASYFPQLDTPENYNFVRAYRAMYGPLAPPISLLGETAYEALMLLARSTNRAGRFDPAAVREQLRHAPSDGPRGTLRPDASGRMHARMYLGQATATGWNILASS